MRACSKWQGGYRRECYLNFTIVSPWKKNDVTVDAAAAAAFNTSIIDTAVAAADIGDRVVVGT